MIICTFKIDWDSPFNFVNYLFANLYETSPFIFGNVFGNMML